ncbi:MAG: mechanosensitive ion channel [Bacteroidales bacterium]|jgi:small conductance mechanosensitive channel|nr:mechanosensitive ion channel [Bacteroidales bacterium]
MDLGISNPLEKVLDKISQWIESFISMLPNMAVAIILFIVFAVLARFGAKMFRKLFSRSSHNKAVENLFAIIIRYTILGLGIFIILGILNLQKTVTSLLAGIGILGLALGFAFQDIASNFVSGIILTFRRPFKIGDVVVINDIMGTILKTNLRVTIVKTFPGQHVFIPNKDVLQSAIYNYTVSGKRRIDLSVGVSYGDDLRKVESLVVETIKKLDGVIDHDNIVFDYAEFGSSSINFNIRFWISYPDPPGFLAVRNQAIIAIKEAFDENDIMIPFPIRTLDFGIKGGEKLSEIPISMRDKASGESEKPKE